MIKPFFIVVAFLILSVATVFVHYLSYDDESSQRMAQHISSVTQLSSPSLSVAYYEPRVHFNERVDNPAYPQMLSLNKMDVVYAK